MTAPTPAGLSLELLEQLEQLVGEPARLRILLELLGGLPLPAGALAARVGLAPSTVSGQLAKLSDAGLITVRQRGRQRLASLDRADVAEAVESLARLTREQPVSSLRAANARTALREARSCYDHLTGRLGVAILKKVLFEMMATAVPAGVENRVRAIAAGATGVLALDKCRVRKSGLNYLVDIHVRVDGDLTVRAGHGIAHAVKDALLASPLRVTDVSVHVEPLR